MSLELEFAAMRVNLRNLTGDILMDMLALRMSYSLLRSRYSTEVRTMNILGISVCTKLANVLARNKKKSVFATQIETFFQNS